MSGSFPLRLHVADTFRLRLLGLHALPHLASDEGLVLQPCRAIHTFFLGHAIDAVFLDSLGRELLCLQVLRPRQIAFHRRASMVVELSAGYCQRHRCYLEHIHAALRLRVSPRLSD